MAAGQNCKGKTQGHKARLNRMWSTPVTNATLKDPDWPGQRKIELDRIALDHRSLRAIKYYSAKEVIL
jgi:hypothetical protein